MEVEENILDRKYKCEGEMANALIIIRQSIQTERKSPKQQPLVWGLSI